MPVASRRWLGECDRSNLTTFNYLSKLVRVVEIDGQLWFSYQDVRLVLGICSGGHYREMLNLVEWQTLNKRGQTEFDQLFSGRSGRATIISESGLYKLVMRSDKPEAREFQDWVTRIVLPAIRKDGGYIAGEEKVAAGEMAGALRSLQKVFPKSDAHSPIALAAPASEKRVDTPFSNRTWTLEPAFSLSRISVNQLSHTLQFEERLPSSSIGTSSGSSPSNAMMTVE